MLDMMTAAPKPIRIGNDKRSREILVGALKLSEFGLLQRWIREHGTPPLAQLEEALKHTPEEEHRKLRYEAWVEQRDDWPPAPYTPKGARVLFSSDDGDGVFYFLQVFLGKHNEVADEEIRFFMKCLGLAELDALVTIAFGSDDLDPKAVWEMATAMRRGMPRPTAESSPDRESPGDSAGPGESGSPGAT